MSCLNLDVVQFAVELFKFQDLADEKVAIAVRHLRVRDVDHIVVDIEVQLETTSLCLNKPFIRFLMYAKSQSHHWTMSKI